MATVTKQVIVDGLRSAVVRFVIQGDTTGPNDLNNQLILDTREDIFPIGVPTQTTVQRIWWNFNGFEGYIMKQDTVPPIIWAMNPGSGNKMDFRAFGGIKAEQTLDGNGDILLTTKGLTDTSVGTLVIELTKN